MSTANILNAGQPTSGLNHRKANRRNTAGFSLVELLLAITVGSMVLAVVMMLSLYGARSLAALNNYCNLDAKSRYALDYLSREIRQATAVTGSKVTSTVRYLTFTNADQAAIFTVMWTNGVLQVNRPGLRPFTLLTGCDDWSFSLYQHTPYGFPTNITFYPATNTAGAIDLNICKVVNMSWKCSRKILQQKINTANVQTAQIVLRTQHQK